MRMRTGILIGLLSSAAVYAQMGGPRFGPGLGGPRGGFGMHAGKVVTNLPFSADVSVSRTETLLDGNTIQETGSGKMARDVQGRTYNLETFTGGPLGQNGPVTRISIFDPVGGFAYELNATTKTAVRRAIKTPPANGGPGGKSGFLTAPPSGGTRPTPPDAVVSDLGASVINGVNATGKKTTRTIAAGAIGNAQPIVSSTETWRSTALDIVISTKHIDPRAGQTTFNLTNIQAAAPDAALFQVPADYKLTDAPQGHRGMMPEFGKQGPPPPPQE